MPAIYHTKGLGIYKQGNYTSALEYLDKSWELAPTYDHQLYLHLREVEQALASQNQ